MQLSVILAISYRDLLKFLRDPIRLSVELTFPMIFIVILGTIMQENLGKAVGYNLLVFTFTGVLTQTMFQSSALGVISLIEDRQNDFTQEIFISPISRYAIIFGKILGESYIALTQGIVIILFSLLVLRIPLSLLQLLALVPISMMVCLFGGAFGVLVLANLRTQQSANQIFPFVMLPQFFLAGVFTPIKVLSSPYLVILSGISPLRYAIDLMRGVFYAGQPDYSKVVLTNPFINLAVMAVLFFLFIVAGTWLFVRNERNK